MNYVKLGDLCEIKSGKRLPQNCDFADRKTQFPYIRARDIKNGRISTEDLVYIEADVQKRIKKYIIEKGDIAITIVGASVGDVGYAEECVNGYNLTENAVRLTSYNEKVYSKYLFYVLYQKQYRDYMQLIAGAAAQPKLGIYKIKQICVGLPEMSAQIKIASIISQYDALIENNNKRIKILEQMAENLYKEWFARFRFPNYQNTEFENGIPKGWNVIRLGELCDIATGKKDANEATGIGKYPFFTCARESNLYTNEYLLDVDAILIAGNGSYTGYVKKYSGRFDLYQRTYALYNFKNVEWLYLYWTMKINFEREFMGGSRGSAIPYITKPNISKYKILLPSKELLKKSQEIFDLIYKKCCLLEQTNQNLIKQRDMLLPRLMSGKLEVK